MPLHRRLATISCWTDRNTTNIRDVTQRLPRHQRFAEHARDLDKIARILLETDAEIAPEANGKVLRRSADGHRKDRMRGIPIVGRSGYGGAIPGTDPLRALIAKENRRRR